MATRHIIPVAASARGKPGLVIEVKQTGSHPLDVRLAASEGENPYVATIKERDIGQLKKKATDEEWESILSHFLLQEQPEGGKASHLDNVHMEYSIVKSGDVHVVIRRDVQGIKQTLGQIELHRDEDVEMDPIEWAYLSAQAHNNALKGLAEMKAKLDEEQATIDKLNKQLEDFIKTKNQAETAMLQQFMGLLNEKKRKIRDQSRLLAGAKIDESVATAVQSAREETKPRRAGASRPSKRKAPTRKGKEVKEESETDDDRDEDQMEIDQSKAEEQVDEDIPEAATPERSADEETEDDDSPPETVQPKGKSTSASASGSQASKPPVSKSPPPPRRELPFARRKAARKEPSPPPTVDDDDTEDDEL